MQRHASHTIIPETLRPFLLLLLLFLVLLTCETRSKSVSSSAANTAREREWMAA
jgi:hypothetical protein